MQRTHECRRNQSGELSRKVGKRARSCKQMQTGVQTGGVGEATQKAAEEAAENAAAHERAAKKDAESDRRTPDDDV